MIERYTLDNGLRVVAQKKQNSFSTSVVVMVRTGGRDEPLKINGISHFVEHVSFKGTKKRATYKEINKELDSLGARYDAFTSVEYTGYAIHAAKGHFEKILDLLSDIVFSSTFPEKEILRERGTILQEINMYEDNPADLVGQTFHSLVSEDVFVAQGVLGTKKSVGLITPGDIKSYHKSRYVAENTMIGCVGCLPEGYIKLLNKHFLVAKQGLSQSKQAKKNSLSGKKVVLKSKKIEQANFSLGGSGIDKKSPDRYAVSLLLFILGGGMSSRLFTEIREKRGLAYAVGARVSAGSDWGYYEVYAGVNPDKIYETIDIALRELDVIKKSITPQELEMAKSYIIGTSALAEENFMSLNKNRVKDELIGTGALALAEKIKNYDGVTLNDVERVAAKLFQPEKMKLAVVGPYENEEKFVKILQG